jgi:signal transduction histidine kinase
MTMTRSEAAPSGQLAIELGEARDELEARRMLEVEERIAADLHDNVVQRLFALGLHLQGTSLMADGRVSQRLNDALDLLDEVIREIRNTVFEVRERSATRHGLEETVKRLVGEMAAPLGFRPRLRLVGSRKTEVSDDVLHQVLAVLRESLSNVSRHAHATRAEVVVRVEIDVVSLSVADDGVGLPDSPSAGDGLANMAERARRLGGSFTAKQRNPTGTLLEWSVPLSGSHTLISRSQS